LKTTVTGLCLLPDKPAT